MFENREKIILVMEYACGGELYDYVSKSGSLPEPEARRIFRQITSAVLYCHKVRLYINPFSSYISILIYALLLFSIKLHIVI